MQQCTGQENNAAHVQKGYLASYLIKKNQKNRGLTKWITPKICGLCVCVLINKRSLEPFMCLDVQGQKISMYTFFYIQPSPKQCLWAVPNKFIHPGLGRVTNNTQTPSRTSRLLYIKLLLCVAQVSRGATGSPRFGVGSVTPHRPHATWSARLH